MTNGKPGDDPLTDILSGRPTISPKVDDLVRKLHTFGVWDSRVVTFLFGCLEGRVRSLREEGEDEMADTLLHNFAFTMGDELDELRGR